MDEETIDVMLKITPPPSEDSLVTIATTAGLHLDDKYREFGGNGLRLPDYVEEDIMPIGIEKVIDGGDNRALYWSIQVRMLRRDRLDDHSYLKRLREYVKSKEFETWLRSSQI